MEGLKRLTKKQRAVYEKIQQLITLTGTSPTLEELRANLNFHSLNSVKQYVDALEERGLIRKRPGQKRSIELVQPDEEKEGSTVVLPVIASAGCDAMAIYADRIFDEHVTVDREYIPKNTKLDNLVIFKAIGRSMDAAGIDSGDYVLAERTDDVETGDRVVAAIEDMAVIKRLHQTEGGTLLEPVSKDARYKKILLCDNARIFGKVLNVIKTRPTVDEYMLDFNDGRREYL